MTVAAQFAEFIRETSTIPEATRMSAIRAVCDLMTAAVVGYDSPGGRAARRASSTAYGCGAAQCWFTTTRLTTAGAAFTNSAIASMLDLDDGHRAAAGHPGASIIPAVLAQADQDGSDLERIVIAIALGYEVGIRIASARDLKSLDTLATGRWCAAGVSAAIGWLRNASPLQLAQAMAIASMTSPHLVPRVSGNNVKEGIPAATATGILSSELAAAGFTGPLHFLDDAERYDGLALTAGLGERWMIDTTYFKPYSCCRWAHAAIDAVSDLQAAHRITPDSIRSIEVHTFARALSLNNDVAPSSLEAAQYSVPFCVGLVVRRGPESLLPLCETSLSDFDSLQLAQRVTLHIDPALDAMFSKMVPARVVIVTDRGRYERTVTIAKGDPENPMSRSDLRQKFATATKALISEPCANAFLHAMDSLYDGDPALLKQAFRTPLDMLDSA